jgi:hypothetical protein
MPTKVYDPKQVTLIIGGAVITGFAEDDFIRVTFPDAGSKVVGADGEVVFSKSPDETAELTFRLKQSSPSNDVLSALVRASRLTNTPIPGVVVKGNGRTLVASPHAWLTGKPEMSFGKEIKDFEWKFALGDTEAHWGGIDPAP